MDGEECDRGGKRKEKFWKRKKDGEWKLLLEEENGAWQLQQKEYTSRDKWLRQFENLSLILHVQTKL